MLGTDCCEDKTRLKKLAKSKGLVITQSSTWEWFKTELKDEAVFKDISEEDSKAHFESLVSKAKEVEEDADKACSVSGCNGEACFL